MNPLRDALRQQGTACTYDRANKGRSGSAPTPRTGLEVVSDLHALVEAADLPAPYVLIGHSAGGLLVQLYARTYPDDVMGVIAMNPVPPYGPWVEQGFPSMTLKERLDETTYFDGQNGEALDYGAASEELDAAAAPPDIPFELFISTIAQCAHAHDICARSYAAYESIMHEIAESWPDGHVSQLDADHELFRHQEQVLALVHSVLERSDH